MYKEKKFKWFILMSLFVLFLIHFITVESDETKYEPAITIHDSETCPLFSRQNFDDKFGITEHCLNDDSKLIDAMRYLVGYPKYAVAIPSGGINRDFWLELRNKFLLPVALSSHSTLSTFLDLNNFFNFSKSDHEIEKYVVKIYNNAYEVRFPCVVKNAKVRKSRAVKILQNKKELDRYVSDKKLKSFIIQDFISGKSEFSYFFAAYQGILLTDTEACIKWGHRKELETTLEKSNPTVLDCDSISNINKIKDIITKIVDKTGFNGFGCVNFKYTKKNVKIWEINPTLCRGIENILPDFSKQLKKYVYYKNDKEDNKTCDNRVPEESIDLPLYPIRENEKHPYLHVLLLCSNEYDKINKQFLGFHFVVLQCVENFKEAVTILKNIRDYSLIIPRMVDSNLELWYSIKNDFEFNTAIASKHIMETLENKKEFENFTLSDEVLRNFVPKKYTKDNVQFPCVVKMEFSGILSSGVHIAKSQEELTSLIGSLQQDTYQLQEAILGETEFSYHFAAYNGNLIGKNDGCIAYHLKKDLSVKYKSENGKTYSPVSSVYIDCNEIPKFHDVKMATIRLINQSGFHGFACINFKVFEQKVKIWEINPRMCGDFMQTHMGLFVEQVKAWWAISDLSSGKNLSLSSSIINNCNFS